jgi:hypothetical protein
MANLRTHDDEDHVLCQALVELYIQVIVSTYAFFLPQWERFYTYSCASSVLWQLLLNSTCYGACPLHWKALLVGVLGHAALPSHIIDPLTIGYFLLDLTRVVQRTEYLALFASLTLVLLEGIIHLITLCLRKL